MIVWNLDVKNTITIKLLFESLDKMFVITCKFREEIINYGLHVEKHIVAFVIYMTIEK